MSVATTKILRQGLIVIQRKYPTLIKAEHRKAFKVMTWSDARAELAQHEDALEVFYSDDGH
jgi:hypothetical protein